MPDQIYSYGARARLLLQEGKKTSRSDQPLGSFYDHGGARFRWAHIADENVAVGMAIVANAATSGAELSALNFTSAVNGYGGAAGDDVIKIYSAAPFFNDTDQVYADGTFVVLSGVGLGHSYRIAHYEPGVTATTTRLWLQDPLRDPLSNDAQVRIMKNPYADLKVASTAANVDGVSAVIPKGFAMASATASGYMFIQTRGDGMGIAGVALSVGQPLMMSTLGRVRNTVGASGEIVAHAKTIQGTAGAYVALDIVIE